MTKRISSALKHLHIAVEELNMYMEESLRKDAATYFMGIESKEIVNSFEKACKYRKILLDLNALSDKVEDDLYD